jgi:hypothetical protein
VLDAEASNIDGFPCRDTCVSSSQLIRPIWSKKEHFSTLKTIICRKYSFKNCLNTLHGPASNIDGFLWTEHAFLPLSCIGLFRANSAGLHHETPNFQEVFL